MLRVEPLRKVYKVGAPLQLRVWIKNVGDKPLRVERGLSMDRRPGGLSIFLYDSNREPLQLGRTPKGEARILDYFHSPPPQSKEDFVLIDPGTFYGREITVRDRRQVLPYAGTFYLDASFSGDDFSRDLGFGMWSGDISSPLEKVRAVK